MRPRFADEHNAAFLHINVMRSGQRAFCQRNLKFSYDPCPRIQPSNVAVIVIRIPDIAVGIAVHVVNALQNAGQLIFRYDDPV